MPQDQMPQDQMPQDQMPQDQMPQDQMPQDQMPQDQMPWKGSLTVVDLTAGIAGGYATKLLVDGGAEVIKVEPPAGDPLRRRSASGHPVDPITGGPLFQHLAAGKASVVADVRRVEDLALVLNLVRASDAVLWHAASPVCASVGLAPKALRSAAPHSVVVTMSPYGLDSSWRDRPANQFTLQAMAGGSWIRGRPDQPPIMAGAEHGDYVEGTLAALSLLLARERALRTGVGELVDCAAVGALQLTQSMFPVTFLDLAGRPWRATRRDNVPAVHPTADGWVGLWVTTGQQWLDFCVLVGRPDWADDPALGLMDNRALRDDELVGIIDAWCSERTTAEVVEVATALRIPVADVANGATAPTYDHYVAQERFAPHPVTGVLAPAVPYRTSCSAAWKPSPSPTLGEHTAHYRTTPVKERGAATSRRAGGGPLDGIRVVDMTAFWAGPIITHVPAMFGADVIHIESVVRPDGFRMAATLPTSTPGWWNSSPFFHGTNTNKRDLAVDLRTDDGRAILLDLVARSDVLVENFSPRVLGQLGLDQETLLRHKPDLITVRAPGFGISGPWAHRVAYAPTIDEAAGLAWTTGLAGGRPMPVGSSADATGGLHATIAVLLALEHRRRTGRGLLVEAAQVGPALAMAAEQVIEYSATGTLLDRVGNRSWVLAPQGVYRCADAERARPGVPADDWVAVSVETDEQWLALCAAIAAPDLADDTGLRTVAGRHRAHDRLDERIGMWTRGRPAGQVADQLTAAGVPAAAVALPHEIDQVPPSHERGLHETVHHPLVGDMRIIGYPARFSEGPHRWHRTAAPDLGQHNAEILRDLLARSADEIVRLERAGVIGDRAELNLGW